MSRYVSQDILYRFTNNQDVSEILDPEEVLKALKSASPEEIKALEEDIKRVNEAQQEEAIKSIDYSTLEKEALSSSWVKYGSFQQIKGSVLGMLTIWVQSDNDKKHRKYGPYTYPYVNRDIWISMKIARGKNGTGAGSVMWNFFLRSWLPSELRIYVVKNKEKFDKQTLEANKDLIKRLTTTFATKVDETKIERSRLAFGKQQYALEKMRIRANISDRIKEQRKVARSLARQGPGLMNERRV